MFIRLFPLALVLTGTVLANDSTAPDSPAASPAAVTAAPPADKPAPPPLSGRIEGGRYFAPSGAFSVAVPKLNPSGAVIADPNNLVIFKDGVSVFVMIGGFAMPAAQRWELETTSTKEFLVRFFREYVLRDYMRDFPGASVEEPSAFLPDFRGGALLVQTLIPGGSAFALDPAVKPAADAPPPAAKRSHLLFVANNHVFVIAIELAERITKQSIYNLGRERENKVLLDRLLMISAAMTLFPGSETTTPAAAAPKPTDTP